MSGVPWEKGSLKQSYRNLNLWQMCQIDFVLSSCLFLSWKNSCIPHCLTFWKYVGITTFSISIYALTRFWHCHVIAGNNRKTTVVCRKKIVLARTVYVEIVLDQ